MRAVVSARELLDVQQLVANMHVDEDICEYIVSLVQATRSNKNIILAASPRASIALIKAASANALIDGRNYVTPSDVAQMYKYVVGHRIVLSAEARLDKLTNYEILDDILKSIRMPVLKK